MPLGTYEALDIGFPTISQGTHDTLDAGSDYVVRNTLQLGHRL